MTDQPSTNITKSDFKLYCVAPRHLWAKKHGLIESAQSGLQQHLGEDGYRTELLARDYLTRVLLPGHPCDEILWQPTYVDGSFETRLDALLVKAGGICDLYEVKSSTGVDKDDIQDVAFQAAVLEKHHQLDRYYVLHLNKAYQRSGELDLAALFTAEDVSEKVRAALPEVMQLREEALLAAQLEDCAKTEACLFPKDCPCPELCHPDLPEFSIYDIPYLRQKQKIELLGMGIRDAKDIPLTYPLNDKQRLVAERARTKKAHIDKDSLQAEVERLVFPLWFLDYETCMSAIPLYDGYGPQQQVVFQYSLHRLDHPDGELQHFGHIAMPSGDPALELLEHLSADLGGTGSVIVWNKTFEKTRNSAMAKLHPEYAAFLENVNDRIYDLADIVNLGYYLHPGFKGSWSLKNVLPVMVPELTYAGMEISQGDQASIAWWSIMFGGLDEKEKEALLQGLEKYCALDSLAMVEIYRKVIALLKG